MGGNGMRLAECHGSLYHQVFDYHLPQMGISSGRNAHIKSGYASYLLSTLCYLGDTWKTE